MNFSYTLVTNADLVHSDLKNAQAKNGGVHCTLYTLTDFRLKCFKIMASKSGFL